MMYLIVLLDLTLILMKFQFFIKDKDIKNEKLAMKKKTAISEEITDRVTKQLN